MATKNTTPEPDENQAPTVPVETDAPTVPVETTAPAVAAGPAPARKAPRWLTPVLALAAALLIGLFAGVFIGQATGTPHNAGFTRQGGFGQQGGAQQGGQGFGQRNGQGQAGGGQSGGGQTGGGQGGQSGQQGTAPQGGTGGVRGGFTTGKIVSIDGDTITIESATGSKVTVTTTDKTTVTTTKKSKVSDLEKGQSVLVRGKAGSNGDVTATSVTEGEALQGFARPQVGAPTN
ncbi:MAG: hypothetical protein JWO10_263 [Microbacteriaceae bacterium]|nr:hypothetical protein [Microbacteriaceae bacterium]